MKRIAITLLVLTARAHAEDLDPCTDTILDPITTAVRDAGIDAQRTACPRDELAAHLHADVLVDTPGFHGVIGGELRLIGRSRIGDRFELAGGLRAVRYQFVQNAVNKKTSFLLGPLTIGGAWSGDLGDGARVALTGMFELPYTRDQRETVRTSFELGVAITAALTERTFLHTRLGSVGMLASSAGGDTRRIALRAGADLVRRFGRVFAAQGGADAQAGWYGGLDHVNLRAGVHARARGPWRIAVGVGLPVGGAEKTNLIFDFGVLRDLH